MCVRINYLAQDRLDILIASNETARWMSQPHTMALNMAKRCGRYSLSKPRMVVDSDYAGCLRTRRSTTGFAAYHGKHVIKVVSKT